MHNINDLGINVEKCLYEEVIVSTALYGVEAWGMKSAERRNVNVLEIQCLRSLVVVSRLIEVRTRAGIERKLANFCYVLLDSSPSLWWLSLGEGWDAGT